MVNLNKADKKVVNGSTREYQFVDQYGSITLVILEKQKSGYEAEIRGSEYFRRTHGLKNLKEVQKWLNGLKKDAAAFKKIEENILRIEITGRGGGVEIKCGFLGKEYQDVKMTAYQNYLGGGMLGKVMNSCNMEGWHKDDKLVALGEDLRKYYHSRSNPKGTFESTSFEQNQQLPGSAY